MTLIRCSAIGLALLVVSLGSAFSADVISDWNTAKTPPPPELKDVTIDPATTALLLLDIMKENCGVRPRCVAAVPAMVRLHDEARAKNMVVWYSLVGSNGKATPDDAMEPKIKPRVGEWYRPNGPDKFVESTLEPTLKQAGVKTVVICGTSYEGATVGTASGAAQRGYKVIVPVDCSASEDVYREQYATYHLGGGGPASITRNITLTRSSMIKF
ncbi:MAG: isochorismatase family protein [Bradyrhizobiaceae bacterium]|nr:isochorismatase family protein [Bradyrhizobiaceae bacterium]